MASDISEKLDLYKWFYDQGIDLINKFGIHEAFLLGAFLFILWQANNRRKHDEKIIAGMQRQIDELAKDNRTWRDYFLKDKPR